MIKLWKRKSLVNFLLIPFACAFWGATKVRRAFSKPFISNKSVVICVGNATVGGAGKTPFTILISRFLSQNYKTVVLTRGYKSKIKLPYCMLSVGTKYNPEIIGDEPSILVNHIPVLIAKNRALGVRHLEGLGYEIIIMDDGFQNPTIKPDINLLLFDGYNPVGNGFIIPSGPMRETLGSALSRSDHVIITGKSNPEFSNKLHRPYLECKFLIDNSRSDLLDKKTPLFAFSGIGNNDKFFDTLTINGYNLVIKKGYVDHKRYSIKDFCWLFHMAKKHNLQLVTTEKDYTKVPDQYQQHVKKIVIKLDIDLEFLSQIKQSVATTLQNKATNP